MLTRDSFWIHIFTGIVLSATSSFSIAVPFALTPVGPIRIDGFHIATGLNDIGLVAGTTNEGNGSSDAFLWDSLSQTYTPLGPLPPGMTSRGVNGTSNKINNEPQLTGTLYGAGPNLPYLWQAGVTSVIPLLPGATSGVAENISDGGHIVGYNSMLNGASLPFLYSSLGLTQLPLLPGMDRGNAVGVNAQGDAVGYQQDSQSQELGVVWISGVPINLGANSYALAINNLGVVAAIKIDAFTRTFFLWNNGQVTDLFSAQGGRFYAISESGGAVGSVLSGGEQFAFLWDSTSGLLNLNDQIDPLSGWELTEAHAINELGQIVGLGINPLGVSQGFLLTRTGDAFIVAPGNEVPEPVPMFLIAAGVLAYQTARSTRPCLKRRAG